MGVGYVNKANNNNRCMIKRTMVKMMMYVIEQINIILKCILIEITETFNTLAVVGIDDFE